MSTLSSQNIASLSSDIIKTFMTSDKVWCTCKQGPRRTTHPHNQPIEMSVQGSIRTAWNSHLQVHKLSTSGKDIRLLVQQLNANRGRLEEEFGSSEPSFEQAVELALPLQPAAPATDWSAFLQPTPDGVRLDRAVLSLQTSTVM